MARRQVIDKKSAAAAQRNAQVGSQVSLFHTFAERANGPFAYRGNVAFGRKSIFVDAPAPECACNQERLQEVVEAVTFAKRLAVTWQNRAVQRMSSRI